MEKRSVWDRLEESLLTASDEEIVQEVREDGLDPEVEAERVRSLLIETSKSRAREHE